MNEDELRIQIYEYLGLEVGSLSSESGNDWERAKKEVLDDFRRAESNNKKDNTEINYLSIEKSSKDFQYVLHSKEVKFESKRENISRRVDLDKSELSILIKHSSKEILINIVRNYKLSEDMINDILDKSVYLVVKYIIEYQSLNKSNIEKLKNITQNKIIYSELYEILERKYL